MLRKKLATIVAYKHSRKRKYKGKENEKEFPCTYEENQLSVFLTNKANIMFNVKT